VTHRTGRGALPDRATLSLYLSQASLAPSATPWSWPPQRARSRLIPRVTRKAQIISKRARHRPSHPRPSVTRCQPLPRPWTAQMVPARDFSARAAECAFRIRVRGHRLSEKQFSYIKMLRGRKDSNLRMAESKSDRLPERRAFGLVHGCRRRLDSTIRAFRARLSTIGRAIP
jgi:hypothetical protein